MGVDYSRRDSCRQLVQLGVSYVIVKQNFDAQLFKHFALIRPNFIFYVKQTDFTTVQLFRPRNASSAMRYDTDKQELNQYSVVDDKMWFLIEMENIGLRGT